tara:strand:- start:942 stop:1733 length:792 start_codon:yes stop_codon:yes gene_type:complete
MTPKQVILYDIYNGGHKPQSTLECLEPVMDVLSIFKPKNVLEVGLGGAAWSILLARLQKDPSINFYGIDNFDLDSSVFKGRPDNINELIRLVDKQKMLYNIPNEFKIYDFDVTSQPLDKNGEPYSLLLSHFRNKDIKYDCIRLDCLCQDVKQIKSILYHCLEHTTDEFILLIDDIGANECVNRFIAAMELVKEGKIKPLLFTPSEAAFTNIFFETSNLINAFDLIEDKIYYETRPYIDFHYYGKHTPIIRTINCRKEISFKKS